MIPNGEGFTPDWQKNIENKEPMQNLPELDREPVPGQDYPESDSPAQNLPEEERLETEE